MLTDPGRVPLGRRAWVGDGTTGASIAPDGTVDWYCAGGLTSAPDLWRLLDAAGPAVRIGPRREGSGARRRLPPSVTAYRAGTNVLETVAEGAGGRRLSVVDFMPWPATGAGLVRVVRALSGPVEIDVEVMAGPPRRPGGGSRRVLPTGFGLLLDDLAVAAPVPFTAAPLDRDTGRWRATAVLDVGEELVVVVGGDRPMGADTARRTQDDTETAWRGWLGRLTYDGPYRAAVERALLALRSLTRTGPLGGAPAGAGTTSLPRRPGSERASDGRWVRLRDSARAVTVLAACGLAEDAEEVETWMRHTLTDAHLPWPAWFAPDGQPVPEPEEWPLEGWRRSQPVTAGRPINADVGLVGPVAAAVGASMTGPGGRPGDPGPLSAAFAALAAAADHAADHWRGPDAGCWEIERPLRRYTAGRVEVWSGLRRMAALARAANPLDLRAAAWQQEGGDLLTWLESEAVAADGGLQMDNGSGDEADAALLAVTRSGPWPLAHPIVAATVDRVVERLSAGPLIHRYSDRVADDRAGPDLPDLEASFGAVTALADLGRWDEAHERMEGALSTIAAAGPGTVSETADPVSGELFGNFPCTASSLALVEAALALQRGPR